MTSGPRQIRVACARCGYEKQRTLVAGDDRTVEQLSASLRCGGCRAWGKSGAISVSLPASRKQVRCEQTAAKTSTPQTNAAGTNGKSGAAEERRHADTRPVYVHGTCLNCGHSETFKPKWRPGETLQALARDITCPECGAEGSAGNIYVREATSQTNRRRRDKAPLDTGASILATLAWPFEMLGLMVVIPLASLAVAAGRLLERIWAPMLIGGSVLAGITAAAGAAYVGTILIGAAMSGPAELVLRAVEHEHSDAIYNSPKGGYRERVDRNYADRRAR